MISGSRRVGWIFPQYVIIVLSRDISVIMFKKHTLGSLGNNFWSLEVNLSPRPRQPQLPGYCGCIYVLYTLLGGRLSQAQLCFANIYCTMMIHDGRDLYNIVHCPADISITGAKRRCVDVDIQRSLISFKKKLLTE